ncbi:MAG: tetratricopeptide repeat protein [Reichenbachiella sp.]|uniref:tetratricopeptide repeat protein n=1 Tax=Reichenbachiella sp. TaxID=2184521 RepID=UPI0032677C11
MFTFVDMRVVMDGVEKTAILMILVLLSFRVQAVDHESRRNRLDSIYKLTYYESDFEQCRKHLSNYLALASSHDRDKLSKFYFLLGYKAELENNYLEGLMYYESSAGSAEGENKIDQLRSCAVNMSRVYQILFDKDRAKEHTKKAYYYAGKLKNDTLQARYLFDLGLIFKMENRIDSAMVYFERAFYRYKGLRMKEWQADVVFEFALCEMQMGRYNRSDSFFEEAGKIQKNSEKLGMRILESKGKSMLLRGKKDEGLRMLKQARIIQRNLGLGDMEIPILNGLGYYHFLTGEFDMAVQFYKKAIKMNRLNGNGGYNVYEYMESHVYLDSMELISGKKYHVEDTSIYRDLVDYSEWYKQYCGVVDQDIMKLQSDVIDQRRKVKEQKAYYQLIVGIIIGIAFSIIGLLLFNNYRSKKKGERKLSEAMNELTDLKKIEEQLTGNPELRGDENLKLKEGLDELKARLSVTYPELNEKEIRYLCYIYIGLSSKQSSKILETTMPTLRVMRVRMGKKMNTRKGEKLDDVINELKLAHAN